MNKERLNALKEQIKIFNFQFVLEIIEELEKENEELKKQIMQEREFKTQTELNYLHTIKEFKAQIEKMKCCQNCENDNAGVNCLDCFLANDNRKWKLKENE